jgi:protein-serine/threonine kinase
MDQLRHLMYNPPAKPNPWDPTRRRNGQSNKVVATPLPGSVPAPFPDPVAKGDIPAPPASKSSTDSKSSIGSRSSGDSSVPSSPSRKDLAHELEIVLNRGHPNIVKLLDFFEDREFYYRKHSGYWQS